MSPDVTPDTPPTCENCQWSDVTVDPEQGPILWCRRNPPQVVGPIDDGFEVLWPPVEPNDWCGEHTPTPDSPNTSLSANEDRFENPGPLARFRDTKSANPPPSGR